MTDPECEEVGTVTLPLTEMGREDPLFRDFSGHITCHTGHSDCVVDVPSGVDLLVTGIVHGVRPFGFGVRTFTAPNFTLI